MNVGRGVYARLPQDGLKGMSPVCFCPDSSLPAALGAVPWDLLATPLLQGWLWELSYADGRDEGPAVPWPAVLPANPAGPPHSLLLLLAALVLQSLILGQVKW